MPRVVPPYAAALMTVLLASAAAGGILQRPDFSGRWTFDRDKSMKPGPDGRVVLATIMGDEFVAVQDASSLTLQVKAGELSVNVVYRLDGTETRNVSPGVGQPDIPVTSRASWDGDKLVIRSTSSSIENGRVVTLETTRVLYLDDGDLVIERTGTPPDLVKPSRSVYRRAS